MTTVPPLPGGLILAVCLLCASRPANAAEAVADEARPPVTAAPSAEGDGRWSKQGSSLVLYDSSGTIVTEIPLASSEETAGPGTRVARTTGGTSADGRFAWTLEKRTTWNSPKTKLIKEDRLLRYHGTSGRELWTQPGADAPPHSDPASLSRSGETVAVAIPNDGGWTVSVRTFVGTPVWETATKGLSSIFLNPEGTYALFRWTELDKSATHSFVELATGARKDIPSDEFVLGSASVTADGKVFSGTRLLHDFKKKNP
ncbi:MAG: hypothetical protein HZB91_00915 [Elusimicrobia bacterium]|nr:hypothetical protein [Elusimicrobiota bacterium]